jgi:hypothetical protein
MKPYFLMLGLAMGIAAQAQDKLKSDPGYSPHNYKHANKAAEASKWPENRGLSLTVPTYDAARISPDANNYKRPGGLPHRETGIVRFRAGEIDTETNPSRSPRNYKAQHRVLPNNRALADVPAAPRAGDSEEE